MTNLSEQTIKTINHKLTTMLNLISGDKALLNAIQLSTPTKVTYETTFTKHHTFNYNDLDIIRTNLKKLYDSYGHQFTNRTLSYLINALEYIDTLLKHYEEKRVHDEQKRIEHINKLNELFKRG